MGVFVTSANEMYSPITTLRANNCLVKHIPWSAFKLSDRDWHRVVDARNILGVSFPCSQFEQKLIVCLGLESNSTVLLGRHPSHPLVRPSRPRRPANGLGEETRCTQV
jgi:hypothetical protein